MSIEQVNEKEVQAPTASDSGDREIQAESSQQQNASKPQTSLEKYCDENPSASQCLIYEE